MSKLASDHPYRHLLAPGRIGTLELRNRIFMSPMGAYLAEADGTVGERKASYFEARARGGAGLIMVGSVSVAWPIGASNEYQVGVSDDRMLPGLTDLARRVHSHGAKLGLQLHHAGKTALEDVRSGRPLMVPSDPDERPMDMTDVTAEEAAIQQSPFMAEGARMSYKAMDKADIEELTLRFAEAAERARRAGIDAVEIHGGHGYLFSAFLSQSWNRRDDEYGGPIENRARFLLETIRAVKERAGSDFPVWVRIDGCEYFTERGIQPEDAQRTAELIEEAGADAVHVSAHAEPGIGLGYTTGHTVQEPCGFVELAAGVKKRVGIPVITVGRIEPEEADSILARGDADFVSMGRKLLADPELPNKLVENRSDDIRPCIYCYACIGRIFMRSGVRCAVNPRTGREHELSLTPAQSPRRVLVVGGGPAGMEAARVAALRGHRVILCEKASQLGGTLFFGSLVYPPNEGIMRWLERQILESSVDLRLDCQVTPDLVREIAPDAIVVAVGARRAAPPIPGADRDHVYSGDELRALITGEESSTAHDKLSLAQRALLSAGRVIGATQEPQRIRALSKRWLPLGRRVAILGGGLVGVELGQFFAERGREVTILEEAETLASEMALPRRWRALHELNEHGVHLLRGARVQTIGANDLTWLDREDNLQSLAADSVVIAIGTEGNLELGNQLAKECPEAHLIGDCSGLGYIEGAIEEGFRVALDL